LGTLGIHLDYKKTNGGLLESLAKSYGTHLYVAPPPSPSELIILCKPISPRAGGGLFNPENAKVTE
jgi:hypothetical protein